MFSIFEFNGSCYRYTEAGIDVGEIKVIAFVAPLKWTEYKPIDDKSNELRLVKYWDDEKWQPIAVQTILKRFMSDEMPKVKLAKDVLRKPDVFLFGGRSHYYGEKATIADAQGLETHGRINSEFFYRHFQNHFPCLYLMFFVISFGVQGSRAEF